MCEKLPYNGRRIDPCMVTEVDLINATENLKTVLSCCGHGKYHKTMVVQDKRTGVVFEYYSDTFLSLGVRKSRKYYQKDTDGYYFIPEVEQLSS